MSNPTMAEQLADAPAAQGVAPEYYTVEESSAGWTIYWPDRPGYFYGFGYGEEAEVRAKSVCRALNKERTLWAAAPAVEVDEALYTVDEVVEAMGVLRGRGGSSAITDDALAEMERVLLAAALGQEVGRG